MEYLVRLFRALANRNRIRIVRLLSVLGEMNVSALARATGLELPLVSDHLRILTAAGLTWRRRSGRVVHYRPPDKSRSPVVAAAWTALGQAFASVRGTDPKRIAGANQADSPTRSDEALFACFTAFTHPRRLQIIRHLSRRQSAGLTALSTELSMSPRACLRHLDKLKRRGLVLRKAARRHTTYSLRRCPSPIGRRLLEAVRARLSGDGD